MIFMMKIVTSSFSNLKLFILPIAGGGRCACVAITKYSNCGNKKDFMMRARSSSSTQQFPTTTTRKESIFEARPMSEIPFNDRHWILNAVEMAIGRGGTHKHVFKMQESILREFGPISIRANHTGNEVWMADPLDVAAVFHAESEYPRRVKVPVIGDFYKLHLKDPGVFFNNGDAWQKHKRLMSKKMLRPLEINRYIPRINQISEEMIARIVDIRNVPGTDKAFEIDDIDKELFKWSFETVTDFLFDRRFGALEKNPQEQSVAFIKAVGNFLDSIVFSAMIPAKLYKYYHTKSYKTFMESFLSLYKFADSCIAEKLDDITRRKTLGESFENSRELIPFLLASKKINTEEVGSSVVDTLFAGVDTTGNTMLWMLYLLAKNPEAQARVVKEISEAASQGSDANDASLKRMPLLRAVIKETLRLNPLLITTGRFLQQGIDLPSGFHLPAKTSVIFMHHVMGRRGDIFENPLEFLPERWLRQENSRLRIDAFASIPFGFGVRMCLGRRLAELELQILLVKILEKFSLELPLGHIVENYFRSINVPDRPIRVKFVDRN